MFFRNNKRNEQILFYDDNKLECSLIKQLRELQKQKELLVNKQKLPQITDYFTQEYVHSKLIYVSIVGMYELPNNCLEKINCYINDLINYQTYKDDINIKNLEIDKQINDIKSQLEIK